MMLVRSYPKLTLLASNCQILGHGNSILFGEGASNSSAAWMGVMQTYPVLAGKGITVLNRGVGGQSIATPDASVPSTMMETAPSVIDASLHATKINILMLHEFINEVKVNGLNAAAAQLAFRNYCLARRAAATAAGRRLWIIVMTTTPAGAMPVGQNQTWVNNRMQAIRECNEWLRLNYRSFADQLIDVAAYEPFASMYAANDWTTAAFTAQPAYLKADGTVDKTHPGNIGHAVIGYAGALGLGRIPLAA